MLTRTLALSAFLATLNLSLTASAQAQTPAYPSRAVTLVVPYSPGGTADQMARILANELRTSLGQPVIVENRPGGGTMIASRAVANATPDGYTLILGTISSHSVAPLMNKQAAGYDPVRDFVAVAPIASIPYVLLTQPALRVANVKELVKLASSKSGGMTYASAGMGTTNHLAGELLNRRLSGVGLTHVPYKGNAPALVDLLGGQVDVMFGLLGESIKHVEAGSLRAVAIASAERVSQLPNVATFAENGLPDFQVSAWFGVFAPKGTPAPIVDQLNRKINAAFQAEVAKKFLYDQGSIALNSTSADFQKFIQTEYRVWGEIVATVPKN